FASPPPFKTITSLRLCLSSTLQNHSFDRRLPSPDPATPSVLSFRRTRHSAIPLLHSPPQPWISSPLILCSAVRPLPLPFLAAPPRTKTHKLKNPDLFDLVWRCSHAGTATNKVGIWILDLRIGGCGGRISDQWREAVAVLPPSLTFCLRRRDWWVAGCDTATGGEWRDEEK
ncbi:unnamed protein product, partial [Linum tenue]